MWRQIFIVISVLSVTALGSYVRPDGRPVVDVPQGTIVGINETRDNISFYSFKSIPFGEPPVDEMRFMKAIESGPWEGELDASSAPERCTQFGIGREDCLYLNVYTPERAIETNLTEPLPVMVWIYGGAFLLGSINGYDRVQALLAQDIVVALVQYRVGVLGFLSSDDNVAPGNQGLWDQQMGLKWVSDNIEYFGGDPNKITLFGESAGSASTHFHTLSPYSQGLFHQVIMHSGNTFTPWAQGRDFNEVCQDIAMDFDCPTNTSVDMIACLQTVNHRTLSLKFNHAEWNIIPFYLAPRIDGDFIPDHPARLVRDGNYLNLPTIMGTVLDEGALFSGELYALPQFIDDINNNFSLVSPFTLFLYEDEGWDSTPQLLYDRYLDGKRNIGLEDADNLTLLYTHTLFQLFLDQVAEIQSADMPTYIYELTHRGENSLLDLYETFLGLNITQSDSWVCHADDLQYIFSFYAENDKFISDQMVAMWTNFAKTGNPTPDASLGYTWDLATPTNMNYLEIGTAGTEMRPYSRQADKDFFETLPLRVNRILAGESV